MIDLKFNNVSKRYRVPQEAETGAARNPIVRRLQSLRRPAQDFWAVRNVSFDVERAEALGIIGHNGAGKSTVLKLLSNITTPSSGEITINGRLSALIEVGSGFHPELTGRENAYLSGSILGMSRREITAKLDSIVEFAGLRQFIDVPVKRYSSGMYVRLGFSIAAHLDPDILLLDEVLAVGDAAFQAKCLQRIRELREAGTTIVFISHDLGAVERVCDRVLLMQRGEVVADGSPLQTITEYQRRSTAFEESAPSEHLSKEADITSLSFHRFGGEDVTGSRTGDPLVVRVNYVAHQRIADAAFEVFFSSPEGEIQCHLTTGLDDKHVDIEPGAGSLEFSCPELGLLPGLYNVDATIIYRGQALGSAVDWRHRCATLRVEPGKMVRGNFYMPYRWHLEDGENRYREAEAVQEFSGAVSS